MSISGLRIVKSYEDRFADRGPAGFRAKPKPKPLETDVTLYAPEFKSLLRTKSLETKIARSLVKAAHRQQYQRVERDVAKEMLKFFKAQTREVTKKLFAQSWTPDPDKAASQAKKLVAKAFDEDKWNEELVRAAGQPMADAFLEGAIAEVGLNAAAKRRKMQAAFNPDQPRDEAGRWADGGGGSASDTRRNPTQVDVDPSEVGTVKAWRRAFGESPPEDSDHIYHATSSDRMPSITDVGLVPGSAANFEQSSGGHVSMSPTVKDAEYWSSVIFWRQYDNLGGKPYTPVLLRTAKSEVEHSIFRQDEVRTESSIEPSMLQLWSGSEWEPIKHSEKGGSYITKDADDFEDEYEDIDFPTEMPDWLREAAQDYILETFEQDYWLRINITTREDIEGVLYRAIEEGLSIRDIAREIRERTGNQYSRARATNVARTETTGAMNSGHVAGIRRAYEGIDEVEPAKEWLSVLGTTTRDEHADADGQQRPVNDDFEVGGEACQFPGDARLSAGMRCNCQCTVVSAFVGEGIYDDEDDKGYNPDQPRDDIGRWTDGGGGAGGSAPDRGDGSGAGGTSPSGGTGGSGGSKPSMPKTEFSRFVRDEHKFKDRLAIETTDGRKFIGRSTSKAADGESILVRGKYEGTKGRKTELEVFKAENTSSIKVDGGKSKKPPADEKPPAIKTPPQPKTSIPEPPAKFTAPIAKQQDEWIDHYASKAGVSSDDLKAEWQSSVESAVADAKVYVAMPPEVVERVLVEGRYKSQFETNSSYGGDVQIDERRHAEEVIFGTPKNLPDKERAVYGYASAATPNNKHTIGDPENNHHACLGYGSAIVQYKDDVKARATITFGDSLNRSEDVIPSPMLAPSLRSVNFSRYNDEDEPPAVITRRSVDAQALRSDDERIGDYTEVQVHGGLHVSEIDTVWFRKDPPATMQSLLKERGIKWQKMK